MMLVVAMMPVTFAPQEGRHRAGDSMRPSRRRPSPRPGRHVSRSARRYPAWASRSGDTSRVRKGRRRAREHNASAAVLNVEVDRIIDEEILLLLVVRGAPSGDDVVGHRGIKLEARPEDALGLFPREFEGRRLIFVGPRAHDVVHTEFDAAQKLVRLKLSFRLDLQSHLVLVVNVYEERTTLIHTREARCYAPRNSRECSQFGSRVFRAIVVFCFVPCLS